MKDFNYHFIIIFISTIYRQLHNDIETFTISKFSLCNLLEFLCFPDAFTTRDIDFKWAEGIAMNIEESVELPQFFIQSYWTEICTRMYSTGEYPCVEALIKLQRQTGYYIIQTYIPTLLIVCLSWISFWIDATASTARVALGITTVLTMTTQTSSAQESLPKVGGSNLADAI